MYEHTLYGKLWLRMALAGVVGLVTILVVVAVEFAVGWFLALFVIPNAMALAGGALVFAVLGVVCLLLWWLSALLLGLVTSPGFLADAIDDDAVAPLIRDIGQYFWNPPRTIRSRQLLLVGLAVTGLALGYLLFVEGLGISPVRLSAVGGVVFVAWHTYRVVSDEYAETGVVQSEVNETYNVIPDPQREAAVSRRVHRLAQQAGTPAPTVKIGASYTPQAATVGYRPDNSVLVVTRGLVDELDDRQLDAVLAHELAHLTNRDAAVLTVLSLPASRTLALLDRIAHPLVIVAVGPVYVLSRLSVAFVARYREFVADYSAARLTGDPAALASALAQLDSDGPLPPATDMRESHSTVAFGIVPPPWEERRYFDGLSRFLFRRLLGTHPSTETRIERLQALIE